MRVVVSQSYSIDVPPDLRREVDDRVTSFWREGESLLLQLSSLRRSEGRQIKAIERLHDRLTRESRTEREAVTLAASSPDRAGALFVDDKGFQWVYYYLVWPDLTVLATISDQSGNKELLKSWASRAVESIKRPST